MGPVSEAEHINVEPGAYQPFDGQTDCEVCSEILLCASQADGTYKEPILGTAEDLLLSQCSHVALFKDWLQERVTHDPGLAKSRVTIGLHNLEQGFIHFQLETSPGVGGCYYASDGVGLLRKVTVPDHTGVIRAIDPQWVDVSLLKQWITTCDTDHGDQCRQSSWLKHLEATRPKYLVDTLEMCVVRGNRIEAEYIALSYQWGQTETLRNTTKVRERLLKPSSLAEWDLACCIPQTIRDAFGVVRLLGYRYLWVDALCVVQDDHAELAAELRRMHLIYNSASFTIVAADGFDASYGLRGLEGLTAARKHPQKLIPLPESERMAMYHPSQQYQKCQDRGAYQTRAWTFQEYHFSIRRLVFNMNAVEWHCENGQMHEDVIGKVPKYFAMNPLLSLRATVPRELASAMPTPDSLADIVNAFNGRKLSFPEDALPAFAGIQSLLEQFYQPGFLYGIPEFWFELALFWSPNGTLNRRRASSLKYSGRSAYQLPSWSWIGWTGPISFPGRQFSERLASNGDSFTEPVTTWCTLAYPTSSAQRPINTEWHRYRSEAIEGRLVTLPEGWKRESLQDRGTVFKHTRSRHLEYSYPFPVPDPSHASGSVSVAQTAFLTAQTSRAFLRGVYKHGNKHTEAMVLRERYPAWVISSQGQYVGYLRLNNEEEQSLFKHTGSNSSSSHPLELVAISKGITVNFLLPGIDSNECEKHATDCIYVLWIEWEDGVAYRRACGIVTAEAWEQEREKELVDLILG